MDSIRRYLQQRASLAGALVLLGGLHFCSPAPPKPTEPGLADALGRQVARFVEPNDISWEPSAGVLQDLLFGRNVLFLAADEPGEPRDLYRARLQVTREGQPLRIRAVRNLTRSPFADEAVLEVRGDRAVFATVAYGSIQSITVLDLDGWRAEDRLGTPLQQWLSGLNEYQRTATFAGLGRADVVFDVPTPQATLTFNAPHLGIAIDGAERDLHYDVERRDLSGLGEASPYGARLIVRRQEAKPFVPWAVDTIRTETGPEPVAWLEQVAFGARDYVERQSYALFEPRPSSRLLSDEPAVPAVDAEPIWPPTPLPSIWEQPEPGEGTWEPVRHPFLPPLPLAKTDASPYFYQTYTRPDPKRPYSKLLLIAMDSRRLELRMQAGYEDPAPLAGPMGTGRLPADGNTVDRVVATFNGAFKTDHGAYGMMVDRRVLLPPVVGGATILVDERGNTGFGSWPDVAAPPPDVVSFRQNLDPLVEDGVVNPSGRDVWGWQLVGSQVTTQRSALCLTAAGHVIYAFGEQLDGETLGRGLRRAGCSYAVHLDMNAGHCGFVYTDVVDLATRRFHLEKASDTMRISADKYVQSSAKDFFYVLVRDPRPPPLEGLEWRLDSGKQPEPTSVPAVFRGDLEVAKLRIEVTSFAGERFTWTVRAGEREPQASDMPPMKRELEPAERERALAAFACGHATSGHRLGIGFHEKPSIRYRSDYATVVVRRDGSLEVLPPEVHLTIDEGESAVQLPLLAEDGELLPRGREPGAMRARGAMCVTETGRVVVARVKHDSTAPAVLALIRAGCRRVVELERGSHHVPFLHRAGTGTPPVGRYPLTTFYALERPMPPRAYRWKPTRTK